MATPLEQIFDSHGPPLATFGESGNGDGQFDYPHGVAVDGGRTIYAADMRNRHVQKLALSPTPNPVHSVALNGSLTFHYRMFINDTIHYSNFVFG